MKIYIRVFVLLILFLSINSYAKSLEWLSGEWVSGKISKVYVDPSDIVFVIGKVNTGPCGSNNYHIRRSNENFKEFYSLIFTAFMAGKSVVVFTSECSGRRNITGRGYVTN